MKDFTFWYFILLGLLLFFIHVGARYLMENVHGWFKKRKNDTVYKLRINDSFVGKHTFGECREIFEDTRYKNMKSARHDRKTKTYFIYVDNH